eukprot:g4937.t1
MGASIRGLRQRRTRVAAPACPGFKPYAAADVYEEHQGSKDNYYNYCHHFTTHAKPECKDKFCADGGDRACRNECPKARICCKAMTAQCLSCAAGLTEDEYCAKNPATAGCPQQKPDTTTSAPPTAGFEDVYGLADKYDCHAVEGNLVQTLKNVLAKNAEASTSLAARCADQKAKAQEDLNKAVDDATNNKNAAHQKAEKNKNGCDAAADKVHQTEIDRLEGDADHAGGVLDGAEKNATRAHNDFNDANKKYVAETARIAGVRVSAKEALKEARRTANETLADDTAELTTAFNTAIETAKNVRTAAEQQCEKIFTDMNAAINADKTVVSNVKGLMFKLTECVKYSDAKAEKTTAVPAAAALVEVGAEEIRCKDMQRELSSLINLKGARRHLLRAPTATGTVNDMERRIQEHIAAAVNKRATCLSNAAKAYDTAEGRASSTKADELAKASKRFADAQEKADKAKEEADAQATAAELANEAFFQEAGRVRDTFVDALNTAKANKEAADDAKAKGTIAADGLKATAKAGCANHKAEAIKRADSTFESVKAQATKDHSEAVNSITEACTAQQAFLADEASNVQKAQAHLGTIQSADVRGTTTTTTTTTTSTTTTQAPTTTTERPAPPTPEALTVTAAALNAVAAPTNVNNVCVSARGDKPGSFTIPTAGKVSTMTITHKSGHVNCRHAASGQSQWGCDGDLVGLVVVKKGNRRSANQAPLLPTTSMPGITQTHHGHAWWYKATGVSKSSKAMTWKVEGKVSLGAGEYELWYNEDLSNGTESDNSGTACYDLNINFQ